MLEITTDTQVPLSTTLVPHSSSANNDMTTSKATDKAWDVFNKDIYLIGIGGCGMSGLAEMLAARGANCSGSDSVPSLLTEKLIKFGINVEFNQDTGELPAKCDLIITSAAIKDDHPEIIAANKRSLPIMSYAQTLGKLMWGRTGVSIAGTHGKSTSTAVLAHILIVSDKDPSFVVGAICKQIGGGSRTGGENIGGTTANQPGLLLAEACEFNRSFHNYFPTVAAILNIEEDHLDYYGSLDVIIEAFHQFAKQIKPENTGGYLLINHDSAHRSIVAAGLHCKVETIGLSTQADWIITFEPETSCVSLASKFGSEKQAEIITQAKWQCPLPGEHNAFNTAVAAVLAYRLGCPWDKIVSAIESFQGIDRRMQKLGARKIYNNGNSNAEQESGEVIVYDDYGHHPTEIDATLRALRAHEKPNRIICVFQPHQHSRTRFLLDQFAASFSSADVVIVPHIYFVRDSETEKHRVSAADLVDRLRKRGVQAMHLYPFDAIIEQLEHICRGGDLVVAMGAGPVWQVAHGFYNNKKLNTNL